MRRNKEVLRLKDELGLGQPDHSLQKQRTTDTLRSAAHGCFSHFAAALRGLCAERRMG